MTAEMDSRHRAPFEGPAAEARRDLRIAEERLAAQYEAVDRARLRTLLAETPAAWEEYRRARSGYERLRAQYEEALSHLEELTKSSRAHRG